MVLPMPLRPISATISPDRDLASDRPNSTWLSAVAGLDARRPRAGALPSAMTGHRMLIAEIGALDLFVLADRRRHVGSGDMAWSGASGASSSLTHSARMRLAACAVPRVWGDRAGTPSRSSWIGDELVRRQEARGAQNAQRVVREVLAEGDSQRSLRLRGPRGRRNGSSHCRVVRSNAIALTVKSRRFRSSSIDAPSISARSTSRFARHAEHPRSADGERATRAAEARRSPSPAREDSRRRPGHRGVDFGHGAAEQEIARGAAHDPDALAETRGRCDASARISVRRETEAAARAERPLR